MTTPNIELLDKVLKHIEDHPEAWSQADWRTEYDEALAVDPESGREILAVDCGTAFCFAGWACQMEGGKWADTTSLIPIDEDDPFDILGDDTVFASTRAQRLLGLTSEQAEDLFRSENTLDDIREMVAEIKAGIE